MISFVINKLLSKKKMAVSLLIGNILFISIAACSPMFSDAVLQKMLNQNLIDLMESSGRYPGLIEVRGDYDEAVPSKTYESVEQTAGLADQLAQEAGVPVKERVSLYTQSDIRATHEVSRGMSNEFKVHVKAASDLENHVAMITGELPQVRSGELLLEAIVSEKTLKECNLFVGEVLVFNQVLDPATQKPYQMVITGVFEPSAQEDAYWVDNPNRVANYLYVNQEDFTAKFVLDEANRQKFSRTEYIMLDYQQIKGSQVQELLELFDTYTEKLSKNNFKVTMYSQLKSYLRSASRLNVTLLVLQMPIFMMLAAFTFTVSRQMLDLEQNEISVIKSRGASKKQILMVYLLQSVLIAVISSGVAIPLSYAICQVIGSANSFLEFVARKALPAHYTLSVWLFGAGAALVSVMTMVLPAIRYSKVGIVDHKRSLHVQKKPLWQKLFLDIVLLVVSLYGLNSYNHQLLALAKQLRSGASLDPLLYLCSAMFILGCALLVVRIFPLLLKGIFALFKRLWSPAMYASFLRMLRSRGNQNFIMIFLILTMALGIFSAKTAYTINVNAEDQIRYVNGADVIVAEDWTALVDYASGNVSIEEPDFYKYLELDGDAEITRVLRRYNVNIVGESKVQASVMGINTKEFGEVAEIKDGLLRDHWYNYLNSMAQDTKGVLVSTSFRDELGYRLGDPIKFSQGESETILGFICGFVDFWPGMTPPFSGDNGVSYFIVAHLSQLQARWGVQPYEIWMKNLHDSAQYIYDFAEKYEVKFDTFVDTNADLVKLKNEPELQATNGILTVGFIAILVLCSVGFLIYWILSIQSRALQFGIFRAMGMSMKEVLGMLLNEQLFVTGISIASGILVGELASQLFVPMIQMVYSSGRQLIPAEIQSAGDSTLKMYLVVGAVIILCMMILGYMIKKIRLAEALKLGED